MTMPWEREPEYPLEELERMVQATQKCDHCGQPMRVYRRVLSDRMAAGLVWLVSSWQAQDDWYATNDSPRAFGWPVGGGDFAKLAWWGLIHAKPNLNNDAKRDSGLWKPTDYGVRFALGQRVVPKRCYHIAIKPNAGRVLGFDDEMVTIETCVEGRDHRFSYGKLMRGEW